MYAKNISYQLIVSNPYIDLILLTSVRKSKRFKIFESFNHPQRLHITRQNRIYRGRLEPDCNKLRSSTNLMERH